MKLQYKLLHSLKKFYSSQYWLAKCVIYLLIFVAPLYAQNPADLFKQANTAYENENFEESIPLYEELLENNFVSVELYYNLGNAYFKSGKIGKTVLNYNRALKLSPRNEDAKFNLEFAQLRIEENPTQVENVFIQFLKQIYYLFNLNELPIITAIFYWLLAISLFIYILFKIDFLKIPNLILSIVFALSLCWCISRIYVNSKIVEAIVIEPQTQAKNGPGDEYAVGFTVPEGKKVLVLGIKDNWIAIGLPKEGLKGWIKSTQLEKI
ncbi:MAG: tetratricopeptide repeat protein [Candidatus Firestonebacteria bacterium]